MPVIQMAFDVGGIQRGVNDAVRAMGRLTRSVDRLAAEYAQAGRAAASSGRTMSTAFNGAAVSIKRLAAEVAGLYGAFKALETAKNFVERGIDVNSKLETARLTIASIVGALNDIQDAQGRTLQGVEKFAMSEKLAANLLSEMRVLAMETTASFVDIADGVAGIIAPATKAGISLEKLPRFVVSAVQAMSAMGLHTTQMRTEIEAILSGNINKAQDLLATNLGITREMVQEWQKAGTLVENLEKKFEMFNIAGTRALTTWAGLKGNMKGGLDELAGFASAELFEHVKTAWANMIEFMLEKGDDGKLHISKNLDGLMKLLQEVEGEIGEQIVKAVDRLLKWIKDLNKPENIAELRRGFEDFKSTVNGVITRVRALVDRIWEVIQALEDMGTRVSTAYGWLEKLSELAPGLSPAQSLNRSVETVTGKSTGEWLDKLLGIEPREKKKEEEKPYIESPADTASDFRSAAKRGAFGRALATDKVLQDEFERMLEDTIKQGEKGKGKPADDDTAGVKLTPTVPLYKPKETKPKKPKAARAPKKSAEQRDAEHFAESSARYAAGLERLRNEVDALEKSMQPGLTTYDRMVIKINAEREAAIKDADVKAQESIRRKECTEAQAKETAELEKRRAALEAKQQLEELERQQLQDKVTWYREYADMTGDSAQAVALQGMAIDQQAKDWVALGIPMDQITERVRRMKNEIATDPLSGLRRGWDSWIAGAANGAQIMESTLTGALDMMSAAFGQFVKNGEVDMESLLNSWIAMINQMVIRAAMAQIFNQVGSLFGLGGGAAAGGGISGAVSGVASAISSGVGLLAAHGYAFSGPGLGAFRNQIVDSPTIFGYGRKFSAYAHGGIMGEAGPEAVVPLTRTRGGDLGIQADGMGAGSLAVTLVIEDRTQDGVTAQATGGELDGRQIAVIVQQVEQAMVSRAMNGRSPYTRYMDRSRQLNSAKALY